MPGSINTLLAQSDRAMTAIFGWAFGLIALLMVLIIAAVLVKKRMSPTLDHQPGGFTLADLRELRRRGAMTEEEFERAKTKIVEGLRKATSEIGKAAAPGDIAGPTIPRGKLE